MSRIGKKPIAIPAKVEVKIDGQHVNVKGPRGQLSMDVHPEMQVTIEDNQIIVQRPSDAATHKALHGLTRALLGNLVTGVSDGFRRTLIVEGVGYQADLRGSDLVMKLGFSHEVVVSPPENIKFDVPKEQRGRTLIIEGIDKQMVGQVAANIRKLRPPEPYKGKGVRYDDEVIRRKAGKTGKK